METKILSEISCFYENPESSNEYFFLETAQIDTTFSFLCLENLKNRLYSLLRPPGASESIFHRGTFSGFSENGSIFLTFL